MTATICVQFEALRVYEPRPETKRTSRDFVKRYRTQLKIGAGQRFLAGEDGSKLAGLQWSILEVKIRNEVNRYCPHGIDGLLSKRRTYSAEIKTQVLSQHDCEQLSSREVYDIRDSIQVVVWRTNFDQDETEMFENSKQGRLNITPEQSCQAPPPMVANDFPEALLEENELLRTEITHQKKKASLDSVREVSCADKVYLIAGGRYHQKPRDLLQAAGMPRRTFYYQSKTSKVADQTSAREKRIRASHEEYKARYG